MTLSKYLEASKYAKDEEQYVVYVANFKRKIGDYDIATKGSDDSKELVKLISEWRMLLGIKEAPTGEEIAFNIKYLKDQYADFTMDKIRLAMTYSLNGVLNVDPKPYGSFSPLYISTILNAYKKYDARIVNDVLMEKQRAEMAELNNGKKTYTHDEKVENRIKYLRYYQSQCLNGYLPDFKNIMWNFLSRYNLLEGIEPDHKMIANERMKAQNQFLDFGIEEQGKIESYSIMRNFFESNPEFDFNKYEVL